MALKDLVNKLKRRKLYINKFQGSRPKDKMDKKDEILADSPKSFKLIRGIERRLDNDFGLEKLPSPEKLGKEKLLVINDVDRFDFDPGAPTDFGIRIQMDNAEVLGEIGIQPNDLVEFLFGELKGKRLRVVELVDESTLRLEDVSTYIGPETDVAGKLILSGNLVSFE